MPIGFVKLNERYNKDLSTYNTIKAIYQKGFTIDQTCLQVGITRQSYYRLLKRIDKPSVVEDTDQQGGGAVYKSTPMNNISSSTLPEESPLLLEKERTERKIPSYGSSGKKKKVSVMDKLQDKLNQHDQELDYLNK